MKYTLNYNYKKPDYTDPADIKDINDNFDQADLKFKEIDDVLGSGVVATPSISYGMNSKIVNPVKVPVIPEVAWSGRHYVNLLGKDGNCEDVSKWTLGASTKALDTTNRLFGSNSIKVTLTGTDGSMVIDVTSRVDKTKYYCLSAYMKNVDANALFCQFQLSPAWQNGNQISTTTKFDRSIIKISPSQMTSATSILAGVYIVGSGAGKYGYVDGVMLTEITQAEYNDPNYQPPPYVDSYGILTNPYIEVRHDNLVRNGNGEEDIDWWSLSYGNVNSRIENGYFVVEDESTSYNRGYNQVIPCKPNTQYTFSTVCKRGTATAARIQISDADNAASYTNVQTTNTTDTKVSATFTTGSDTKRLRVSMISGITVADTGIAYHKEAILVEGSSTPSYKTCKIERCVIEGNFASGDTVTLKNGKAEGLINWKHRTLYGKDYDWQFILGYTGYKFIAANGKFKGSSAHYTNFYTVKYDGKIIPWGNTAGDQYDFTDVTIDTLGLRIPATDSGWSDAVNPNADEIKAFMNGWKALFVINNRYCGWQSIIDRSVPLGALQTTASALANNTQPTLTLTSTSNLAINDWLAIQHSDGGYSGYQIQSINGNSITLTGNLLGQVNAGGIVYKADNGTTNVSLLTWCKNNVAPNYEGYQLHYRLANPEPINDTNTKVVGDIPKIDTGDNYIYFDSGMVLGEIGNVQSSGGWSRINSNIYTESKLKNRPNSILNILKNALFDTNSWSIGNNANNDYDIVGANMPSADYDLNAIYTVDYMILATIAPNVGSISCSFKQDLVSGVTSVANALESRQKSDSALDNLIDESVYEKIVFPGLIGRAYKSGTNKVGFQVYIPISHKKAKPIAKITNYLMAYTDTSGNYNELTKGDINIMATDITTKGVRMYCLYTGANTTIQNNLLDYGGWFGFTLELDCRGRI